MGTKRDRFSLLKFLEERGVVPSSSVPSSSVGAVLFGVAVVVLSLWALIRLRRTRRAEIARLPDPPELLHGLSEETMLRYLDDLEGRGGDVDSRGEETPEDRDPPRGIL